MRSIGVPGRRAAYILLLLAGLGAAAVSWWVWRGRGVREVAGREPRRDVVLAERIDLESTAGVEPQRLIRALLEAGPGAAGLAGVAVDYPLDGTVFPPEITAPTFLWHDEAAEADRWLVELAFPGDSARIAALVPGDPPPPGEIDARCVSEHNEIYKGTPYQASARAWKPDSAVWAAFKRHSVAGPATITFFGYREGNPLRVLSRGRVTIGTSPDPVGAPIFYRDVPLMPAQTEEGVIKPLDKASLPLINWRLRDIARPESRLMLTDMPTCANCHSFSGDGRTMGMDIDGPQGDKGAYAIAPIKERVEITYKQVMTWNAFKEKTKDLNTLGFLSRMSPDGQFVVSTVNEELYVQNFWDYKINQVFYPTRGILAFFSRATGEITALPGADDPEHVHCNPVWSPDGRTIVFARALARDAYIAGRPPAKYAGDPNETPIQYDLFRIPFNDGRGGRAEPIPGASGNGMSNTFPKVSPDGRWVVFVKCRNGQLLRPDGKLFIVPIAGGEARLMRCNLSLMNSWHSFSPNGRWMVFSSKGNRPYTQLFLTHIDAEGRDTPAVLIENSTADNRAVNLPEFVNVPYDRFREISVPAVDHARHYERGNALARAGRHKEAVAELEEALAGEPNDWKMIEWKIHDSLSKSLVALGRRARALEHIRASLSLNPANPEMETNLGNILFEAGRQDEGLRHLDRAIRIAPRLPRPWYDRATMRLKRGDRAGAISDYTEAIRLDPAYADAYVGRATVLHANGDVPGALNDLARALEVAPPDWPRRAEVDGLLRKSRAPGG